MLRIQPRTAILALIVLCVIVYSRLVLAHFVLWDDDYHLFRNPYLVQVTWANILHFWKHTYGNLYIPVSYTVYALLTLLATRPAPEAGPLAGPTLSPMVFHIANIVLHCANVVLAFLILRTLTKRNTASAFGAALFAIHPLQVESVAWVSELRGLLCALFALSSIHLYMTYARWTRAGDPQKRAIRPYVGAIVTMFLAMLSKPAAAPLPLVFLVIDHWAYGRAWKPAAIWSLPWLAALFPFVHITQTAQPTDSFFHIPIWQRVFVAGDALAFYLAKLVCPLPLITEYGRRPELILRTGIPYWDWIVPALVIVGLYFAGRRSRLYVAGGLIALGFLLPVLGLDPFIYQRFSTVADRYCYLPILGVSVLLATFLAGRPTNTKYIASACVLAVLAFMSMFQASYWDNTIKLLEHTVSVNPKSGGTWANLGSAYEIGANAKYVQNRPQSEIDEMDAKAINAMETSVRLDGGRNPLTFKALGDVYMQEHNYPLAEENFYHSLEMDANQPQARANLGEIYFRLGDTDRAIAEYAASIQLDHANAQVREDMAGLLINKHDYLDAARIIEPVTRNFPKYALGHKTFGIALDRLRQYQLANDQFKLAERYDAADPEAHMLSGISLMQMNKIPDGQAEIQTARSMMPDQASFKAEITGVLAGLGLKLGAPAKK